MAFIRRYATGTNLGRRDPWVETHPPALKRRAKFNRRYATGGIGGIVIRGLKPIPGVETPG
jgi:hypothetical protein